MLRSVMLTSVQIFCVIVQIVAVVDNESFFAIDHLNDAEGTEFEAISDVILTFDQQTVLVLVNKLGQVVLDQDLVPLHTNASLRD